MCRYVYVSRQDSSLSVSWFLRVARGESCRSVRITLFSRQDSCLSVTWLLKMARGESRESVYMAFFTSGLLLIRVVTYEWNVVLIGIACFSSPGVILRKDAPPEGGVRNFSPSLLLCLWDDSWFPLSLDNSRMSFTLDEFGLRRWLIFDSSWLLLLINLVWMYENKR